MSHWIERLLNLRRGELPGGLLFFAYYFLIISSYVVGQVARDALFLDRFAADQLPYVDVAIAATVGLVVAAYIRAGRWVKLRDLLTGALGLFSAIALFFWWEIRTVQWAWLFPALYIWIGIFGVLAIAQVWTLANFMLTTREAKRVFGLVGAGGILGGIFGGFLSVGIARNLGAESLLLVVAAFPAICMVLVVWIWRREGKEAGLGVEDKAAGLESSWSLSGTLQIIRSSAHLKSIATLICITSIVTTAAGWQFKAIAKETIIETDALAAFLGSFQGYAGILSLVAQLLLTTRVLQRFGVGSALFILPVALVLGSAGVLVFGGVAAVVALKGTDKVLRYSIDTSALQLLYLPVPTGIKVQVKSFIDTVVLRLGDGLAGVTLLVFVTYLQFTPRQVAWINLIGLVAWLFVANRARRQYLATLGERVQEHGIDIERTSVPVLDRSTASILATKLDSGDSEEILYGLRLFELGDHRTAHPSIQGLIRHDSPEVRARAVAILSTTGNVAVNDEIEELLNDGDLGVRTEALLYLTQHTDIDPLARIRELGDFPDFTIRSAIVAFLSQPGNAQNLDVAELMLDMMLDETGPAGRLTRLEAGQLIGLLPDAFENQVSRLLADPDPEIARYGISAAGNIRRPKFVPALLDRLGDPDNVQEAATALGSFGDRIAGTLGDYVRDPEVSIAVRLEIPAVLVNIGAPGVQESLAECLLEGNTTLRHRILSAMNKYQKSNRKVSIDPQWIETVLAAEILGHYRSYQALGLLGVALDGSDPSLAALTESMGYERERIFRLLAILFPEHDMHAAYLALDSTNSRLHDNTLEFLDNMLRPELRTLLIPLVDDGVTVKDRVRLANDVVGMGVETSEEAVAMLMHTGDPWLKSCAAYAIGALGLKSLESEMDAWQDDQDPLLAEAVRQAKLRLAKI